MTASERLMELVAKFESLAKEYREEAQRLEAEMKECEARAASWAVAAWHARESARGADQESES